MIVATVDYLTHSYLTGYQRNGQIYINLNDSVTNLPTPGYGTIVKYSTFQNGLSIGQTEVTLTSETGAPAWSGTISDTTPGRPMIDITVQIDNVIPGTPPANTEPQQESDGCDLVITGITIDKEETSPGTRDGQMTIHAASSYEPIYYSNGDSGWQLSPIFTGLAGGLQQPVVKDSNPLGCQQQSFIELPISSNRLLSGPEVILPGGNVSRWNAVFNPVIITYQRKDFSVMDVFPDPATGRAVIVTNSAMSPTLIGQIVYVNASPYIGSFKVSAADNYVSYLYLETPFTGKATGYVNINGLRPYYQVQTIISYIDPLTSQANSIKSTNRPDATGLVKADLSNFLQSLVQAKDDSDYSQANYHDTYLSASYQLAYSEYWDGKLAEGETLTFNHVTTPYYAVYAAKQLGDKYGGNLAAYVPFKSVAKGAAPAKWITDFTEPVYSNSYPFDVGFIYSEDLLGLDIYCELITLDINRNPVEKGTENNSLLNEDSSWLLNQDGSRLLISRDAAVNSTLPQQLSLNRFLVDIEFPDEVYYFNLTLKYDDEDGNSHALTQTQTIRIDDAIDENSVYLRWIGLSGSWNYYRFVYNQEVSLDVQNAVIIKNYVSDWENQDGIEQVISKSAGQKMKVMAEDLSVNDIKGLQSIKYSPKVQMLIDTNPVKWQTIVINTATYSEYETVNGQAPFSVTFNMPSINIQTQ